MSSVQEHTQPRARDTARGRLRAYPFLLLAFLLALHTYPAMAQGKRNSQAPSKTMPRSAGGGRSSVSRGDRGGVKVPAGGVAHNFNERTSIRLPPVPVTTAPAATTGSERPASRLRTRPRSAGLTRAVARAIAAKRRKTPGNNDNDPESGEFDTKGGNDDDMYDDDAASGDGMDGGMNDDTGPGETMMVKGTVMVESADGNMMVLTGKGLMLTVFEDDDNMSNSNGNANTNSNNDGGGNSGDTREDANVMCGNSRSSINGDAIVTLKRLERVTGAQIVINTAPGQCGCTVTGTVEQIKAAAEAVRHVIA